MNMKISGIISILLLISLLLTAVSCGGNTGGAADTGTAAISEDAAAAETEDPLNDNLPNKDYAGFEYRILGADVDIPMLLSEEITGSLVNDSVFEANAAVEERFNVELVQVKLPNWSDSGTIKSNILSGSDAFDLGVCHDCTSGNLSLEGLFVDLYKLPYLDFDKPWWPRFTVEGLTLNNRMYVFSNYIGYNGLRGTKNMYVNLDQLKNYDLESPYELVRSGDWLLEKVISMTSGIYSDLDGDQTRTRDDFYGFAFTGLFYGWLENFGIEAYAHKPDDKEVHLNINNQRTADLIEIIRDWLQGGREGVYYKKSHTGLYNPDAYSVMFADGKCLFTYGSLYVLIANLENSDVTYGILPMPKYDENQDDYFGVCYDSPMWVPVSLTDPERTGIILEAMSAEGYKRIVPAYKDITLKDRYATDLDSAEMLDIIFKNRVLSFSYIYGKGTGFQGILNDVVPSDTYEFASYYASKEPQELDRIKEINEFFSSAE